MSPHNTQVEKTLTTLEEVIAALQESTDQDELVVATVTHMINGGRLRSEQNAEASRARR